MSACDRSAHQSFRTRAKRYGQGEFRWQDVDAVATSVDRSLQQRPVELEQTLHRVERLARDAKLIELGGGTIEMQILTIARELLRS